MTPERFRHITEAYGASPERWPAQERDAALALIHAGDARALAALAEARALDGMLDAHAVAAPRPEFARRIVDSAPLPTSSTSSKRPFWRRPRIWFSGAGFVGAGAAGVAAGALLVSLLAPAPADHPHGWLEQSWSNTAFGGASSDWSDQ